MSATPDPPSLRAEVEVSGDNPRAEGRSSIGETGSSNISTDWNLGVGGRWSHVSSGISGIKQ